MLPHLEARRVGRSVQQLPEARLRSRHLRVHSRPYPDGAQGPRSSRHLRLPCLLPLCAVARDWKADLGLRCQPGAAGRALRVDAREPQRERPPVDHCAGEERREEEGMPPALGPASFFRQSVTFGLVVLARRAGEVGKFCPESQELR